MSCAMLSVKRAMKIRVHISRRPWSTELSDLVVAIHSQTLSSQTVCSEGNDGKRGYTYHTKLAICAGSPQTRARWLRLFDPAL
jgi:hypothetical protein